MSNIGTDNQKSSRRKPSFHPPRKRPTGLEIWNGFVRGLEAVVHGVTYGLRTAGRWCVYAAHFLSAWSVHALGVVRELQPTLRALCAAITAVVVLGIALAVRPVGRLMTTKRVDLKQDGLTVQVRTQGRTVADVLTEYDIALGEGDVVYPELSETVTGGDEIMIRRAVEVSVYADGQTHTVSLLNGTVGKALYLAGVSVAPDDIVVPAVTEPVSSGMEITVSRVTIEEEKENKRIPYHITYQDDDSLYLGDEEMVKQGSEGVKEVTYRVVTINGVETERTVVGEEVIEPAQNRIVAQGTRPTPTPTPKATPKPTATPSKGSSSTKKPTATPKPTATQKPKNTPDPDETETDSVTEDTITVDGKSYSYSKTLTVMITAYTHTGRKTSTGVWPEVGTVAVDPDVIPYGTRLYIPGYGFGVAQDTGVSGNHIDVFFDTEAECIKYGRKRDRTIYILD